MNFNFDKKNVVVVLWFNVPVNSYLWLCLDVQLTCLISKNGNPSQKGLMVKIFSKM